MSDTTAQRETAEYVRDIVRELIEIAASNGLPLLAYLLDLASMDADETIKKLDILEDL